MLRTRWYEQFRIYRFDHKTTRAPLVALVGYMSQRSDMLALREQMLAQAGAHESTRRTYIIRHTSPLNK